MPAPSTAPETTTATATTTTSATATTTPTNQEGAEARTRDLAAIAPAAGPTARCRPTFSVPAAAGSPDNGGRRASGALAPANCSPRPPAGRNRFSGRARAGSRRSSRRPSGRWRRANSRRPLRAASPLFAAPAARRAHSLAYITTSRARRRGSLVRRRPADQVLAVFASTARRQLAELAGGRPTGRPRGAACSQRLAEPFER